MPAAPEGAGGSEPKIEVTPEMIEAGSGCLLRCPFFDVSRGMAEELAETVLRDALSVRQNKTGSTARPT